jgi:acyl-CoA reductase-like NAD-dependent aldehyde dehydrogenase
MRKNTRGGDPGATVHKINFKESAPTGHRIAALAGDHLKPVTLELGGRVPVIVLEDADIAKGVC